MLKITRKFDYAMVALTDIGMRPQSPSSARCISHRYGLSPSLTANVLKELQKAFLVRSIRGVRGGYLLARDPRKIRLEDVILAVEGERRLTDCNPPPARREDRCQAFVKCPVRSYVALLEGRIRSIFLEATLDQAISMAIEGRAGKAGSGGRSDRSEASGTPAAVAPVQGGVRS